MTAHDALDAQPSTFDYSILHHRLYHVLTTSRSESATRRRQGRYARAVEIHGQKEYMSQPFFHPSLDKRFKIFIIDLVMIL
jgi:hypothetical protein